MKILVFLWFLPMFAFSQEIKIDKNYIVPRVGYSHHFKTNRNVGFMGLDYISKPDYVGWNIFGGINAMEYRNRLKIIPEAGVSGHILFYSVGASVSTESFQPMVGTGLLNWGRIEGGYSFRFRKDTPFQGWFLRVYVNNFFNWKKIR